MLKNFYKGKKILITGHTGFKGSWLALVLNHFKADVYGIALKPYDKRGNLYNILNLKKIINSNYIDLRDLKKTKNILEKIKPQIIFHLAAQPLVLESYRNPLDTIESNINGLCNILDLSRNNRKLKSFLNVTTDKCYENNEHGKPFKETDRLGGNDIYSASKACSEILTNAYYKSFYENEKVGFSTARAGNIIGGGDFGADRIIPDFIESIQNNKILQVRSPSSIRPWQHILDVINGYLILMKKTFENPKTYTSFNFSPDYKKFQNVKYIVDNMSKILKFSKVKYARVNKNFKESKILKLNSFKAKKELNWSTKYNIDQTLESTANWYEAYIKNENMYDYSINEVESFF
tara:strand:+ start:153 stop:1199 length:1047 start_codon:yes stop_codon:yes gene_type:complete